jgi:hypothetical protein
VTVASVGVTALAGPLAGGSAHSQNRVQPVVFQTLGEDDLNDRLKERRGEVTAGRLTTQSPVAGSPVRGGPGLQQCVCHCNVTDYGV